MKAITVQQPWAWAIIHGGKTIENRTRIGTWAAAAGTTVAIHAGLRWDPRGDASALVRRAWWGDTGNASPWLNEPLPEDLFTFGAVIGFVDVDDVHREQGGCCAPWGETSYIEAGGAKRVDVVHLVLSHFRPVDPEPCTGRLGLWTLPQHVADAIGATT